MGNTAINITDTIAKLLFLLLACPLFEHAQAFRYTRKPHHILIPIAVAVTMTINLIQITQATVLSLFATLVAATAMLLFDSYPTTSPLLKTSTTAHRLSSKSIAIMHTPDTESKEYEPIATRLASMLNKEITVKPITIPYDCYNEQKQAYLPYTIAHYMQKNVQGGPIVLLTPKHTSKTMDDPDIVGTSMPFEQFAIVSLKRICKNMDPAHPTATHALTERLLGTIAHEVLHLYGLNHCRHATCVMYPYARDPEDNDINTHASLCRRCRAVFEAKTREYHKLTSSYTQRPTQVTARQVPTQPCNQPQQDTMYQDIRQNKPIPHPPLPNINEKGANTKKQSAKEKQI